MALKTKKPRLIELPLSENSSRAFSPEPLLGKKGSSRSSRAANPCRTVSFFFCMSISIFTRPGIPVLG